MAAVVRARPLVHVEPSISTFSSIEAYLYSIILSRFVSSCGHTALRSNATSIALRDASHVACCDWSMILVDITPTRLME